MRNQLIQALETVEVPSRWTSLAVEAVELFMDSAVYNKDQTMQSDLLYSELSGTVYGAKMEAGGENFWCVCVVKI
jgi:hypothetical protein